MNATRILSAQHRAIEALFDEVEQETRRRARAGAVSRLAEELIAHVAAEEAVFYPALTRVLDDGLEASEQGRQDHLMLRVELRRVLEASVSNPSFADRMTALRDLFSRHVWHEELALFPRVVSEFSRAQLEVLAAKVLASRPPVWIVTSERNERRSPVPHSGGSDWVLGSSVSLPLPPSAD